MKKFTWESKKLLQNQHWINKIWVDRDQSENQIITRSKSRGKNQAMTNKASI